MLCFFGDGERNSLGIHLFLREDMRYPCVIVRKTRKNTDKKGCGPAIMSEETMYSVKTIEGQLNAQGLKIAIVASRFNDFVVGRLVDGAIDYLVRHGASVDDITVIRVPGAYELPIVCKKLAAFSQYNGIIALGAVIRGATPHFDYVCAEASKGIAQISLQTGLPIGFGLLTCDNLEQAISRAGAHVGNKGSETAAAVLETIRVMEQI